MLNKEKFVNRERELEFFRRSLSGKKAELLLLYGRRRVGKTTLLRKVAELARIPVIYHVAAQTTKVEELKRFSVALAGFFRDPLLRAQPLQSWESALIYLGQKVDSPFVLMFDEFPYAVEGDSSLPSLLQLEWDRYLRKTPIKIILCGSSVSMMERLGHSESSPLYGRRTGQWRLLPFGPEEFSRLWPADRLDDLLTVYCVTGGSPHYSDCFDPRVSLLTNIRDRILAKGSMLYEEVPFLLREEVRDPRVYQAILAAMAGGARKFSELSGKTGLQKAHLTRYIAILSDLGIMEREVPVTELRPEKSRKGLYRIRDPFVAFWYRFVFPNRDRLELGDTAGVLREEVKPALDRYVSLVVEPYLGALFRGRWRHLVPFDPVFMGRYWDDKREIDWLILDRSRKRAVAVEVKWTASPVSARRLAKALQEKIAAVDALVGVETGLVLISRSGFRDTPQIENCVLITLREEKTAIA